MTCCWWCCHVIDGQILKLPFKHNPTNDTFMTMGQYCSWECMKSWNMRSKNIRSPEINQFITLLKKRIVGHITPTRMAPPRHCLTMFGGTVEIDDFRRGLDGRWVQLPELNHCPVVVKKYSEITDRHREPHVDFEDDEDADDIMNKSKIEDIQNSESTGGEGGLRLKRPIPMKTQKNNLETLLGLKLRGKK